MRRLPSILAFTLAFFGCGSSESTSNTGGSAMGGGGTTIVTSTSTSSGGSSSTSSEGGASGGTGGVCDVPQPHPCGPVDPTAYPDDSLTYAPDALFVTGFQALPGESPKGAGAGMLGPFGEERQAIAISVVTSNFAPFCVLPDPVRYAVWTENHCGVPTIDPYAISQEVPLADVEQVTLNPEAVRLTIPLIDAPVTVPAGSALYVALILTEPTTCVGAFETVTDHSARSLWFGRSDLNCDGKTDADLGWAFLEEPTDPSVNSYVFDLGFGAQF